ncbi:MAG: LysR family transcriptional regulator [Mycobacteriales bacterium]
MKLSPRVPDLAALDLLLTVARMGSLGGAAREHGVSQPAASSRLQYLERQVGLTLLARSPTGTRLTENGALVVDWARRVVEAAQELDAGLAALRAERDSQLHVGASLTIAEYLLPGWLVIFRREHRATQISLTLANSHDVAQRVLQREFDLAFVESPSLAPGLDWVSVGEDHLQVVVGPGHPWARRRRAVSADELAGTQLIVREPGSGTREALERELLTGTAGRAGAAPLLELSSTTAIKRAVATGLGPAVISSLAVAQEVREGHLVACPVDGLELRRELRAVWPTGQNLAGPARELLGIARGSPGRFNPGRGTPSGAASRGA